MKKSAIFKLKGMQSLGTWEFMWQVAAFLFTCVFVFSVFVGLFVYIIVSLNVGYPPFSSWGNSVQLQKALITGLSIGMLVFSVMLTILLLELYERIIYSPVKSLLKEVEHVSGYHGLSEKVDYYLRGGDKNPFDLYNPQESWIDRVKDYMENASKDRYFDDLTGCFNRKYLANVLTEILKTQVLCSITERTRPKTHATVCYAFYLIDIDFFKSINDEYGHLYGDQVLTQVGRTLRACVGNDGAVIRNGGEEFLLVVCHHYPMDYAKYAEYVRSEFCDTVFVTSNKTQEVRAVTCSIGFTPFPLFDEMNTLLSVQHHVDLADQAMYLAKSGGRNTWRGIEPMTCPKNESEVDLITTSVEHGIQNNYYRIVKPDEAVFREAAGRPGNYYTRST